jgi:hypothetical protein
MTVKKRNDLASVASMFVPLAADELKAAERCIREQKPDEALKWISEALIHLDRLRQAFAEACEERVGEEAGRLVGED